MNDAGAAGLGSVFADLHDGFVAAAERVAVSVHPLTVAGHRIDLRIAGEAMVDVIVPALEHLMAPSPPEDRAELVVNIWDTATTRGRLPALPAALDHAVGHWHYDGEVCLSFRMHESAVSALHESQGEALHCVAEAGGVAPYDVAHPLGEILSWWLSRAGCFRMHAAAVGTSAGGALLAGPSGSGKSTSALTSQRAGLRFVGDDIVLVRGNPPTAISLYNSGRADRELLGRYPDVLPDLDRPSGEEKAVRFFAAAAMTSELPLRAIVLPRVVRGGTCRVSPGKRGDALRMLAPWAVLLSPGDRGRALSVIRDVVAALPVYELTVGDDLPQIPVLLSEVIEESARCL